MSSFSWLQLVSLMLVLILPISALAAHRMNWSQGIKLALIWAAIFAGVTAFVSLVS